MGEIGQEEVGKELEDKLFVNREIVNITFLLIVIVFASISWILIQRFFKRKTGYSSTITVEEDPTFFFSKYI